MAKNVKTAETAFVAFHHEMDWQKNGETIGEIEFDFEGKITIDGVELPENAVKFILDWGFKQPLMNAYADSKKDAKTEWTRVLGNILAGKVSAEGRTRIDPVWAEMRVIVAPQLAAAMGFKTLGAAQKGHPDGAWLKLVDAAVKKHEALVRPTAEKTVADRKMPLGDALRASLLAAE